MAALRMLLFGQWACSMFLLWSFGGWLFLKKTFFEYCWNYVRIFSKWLIYILKAFFKGFLTRYCTMHEIEYFQKLSWNTVYIYIFFRSQRSQSQLRINYHSKQVTSNKLSPFQWISSVGKLETVAQSIHSGGTRAWTGTQAIVRASDR